MALPSRAEGSSLPGFSFYWQESRPEKIGSAPPGGLRQVGALALVREPADQHAQEHRGPEARQMKPVARRRAFERGHDEPGDEGREDGAEQDRADPISARAPRQVGLDQHEDDAPYAAPERQRDHLGHPKRRDRPGCPWHGRRHAQDMQDQETELMESHGREESRPEPQRYP